MARLQAVAALFLAVLAAAESFSVLRNARIFSNQASRISLRQYTTVTPTDTEISTSSTLPRERSLEKKVYCNTELNGTYIEAYGFDMDYTLAQYKEAYKILIFESAKKKLYEEHGYPKEVLDFEFSLDNFTRGLIIDKTRGNFIKLNRHKYPYKVLHGETELSSEERRMLYSNSSQVYSFTEDNMFVILDTFYPILDAVLYAPLVVYKDKNPDIVTKSYSALYADVRKAIDMCHRENLIKGAVLADIEKYINYDPGIVPMFKRLRSSGKKTFLLTNSDWEYTDVVMEYLVHGGGKYGEMMWEDLFDCIITRANKPSYIKQNALPLLRVANKEGDCVNVDRDTLGLESLKKDGKVFEGGTWRNLHKMLEISSGDKVLYTGDHMYQDILRSKRTLGWRTCLILPELEHDVKVFQDNKGALEALQNATELADDNKRYVDDIEREIENNYHNDIERLNKFRTSSVAAATKAKVLRAEYEALFNPRWGRIFKAGPQNSRFAKQVEDYACLYTSRASNFALTSPNRQYRPLDDDMAHDLAFDDSLQSRMNSK
jgi:HAD superfamily 5'-nucleotidase-like hydrolase